MSKDENNKFDYRILISCASIVIAGIAFVGMMSVKLYQVEENRNKIDKDRAELMESIKENRSSINQLKDHMNTLKNIYMRRVPNDDVIGGE